MGKRKKLDVTVHLDREKSLEMKGCERYDYDESAKMFVVEKDGARTMIPRENVVVIGISGSFDLEYPL